MFPGSKFSIQTSITKGPHPNRLDPNTFARISSVFLQSTWKTLDTYISPYEPQPTMRLPSQPTLVQCLPHLRHLTNYAPLISVSFKSNFYSNEHVHVTDNRLVLRRFPRTPSFPVDPQFHLDDVTNRLTDNVLLPMISYPHTKVLWNSVNWRSHFYHVAFEFTSPLTILVYRRQLYSFRLTMLCHHTYALSETPMYRTLLSRYRNQITTIILM